MRNWQENGSVSYRKLLGEMTYTIESLNLMVMSDTFPTMLEHKLLEKQPEMLQTKPDTCF